MKRQSAALTVTLVILLMVGTISPALAQGLDQTFEWLEAGLRINYPTGWTEAALDNETRVLYSDPTYDITNSNEPPESPAVLILALPLELAAMMGGTEGLLEGFGGEFGVSSDTYEEVMIAGQEALRVQSPPDAALYADMVAIESSNFYYVLMGISAADQAFTPLFDSMLETLVIVEAAAPQDGPIAEPQPEVEPAAAEGLPPVNGVMIQLDQTLTDGWNEIDAVELVGLDASGSEIGQWATSVEATSQYAMDSWSAEQVLGEPDTFECGDIPTAWASATSTGRDTLTLRYDSPVQPTAVNIYETYNPGAITQVALLPANGGEPIVIFAGVDPTTDCPGVFSVTAGEAVSGSGGTLDASETISSSLDNTTYSETWEFEGAAGDTVTITMVATSGNLDTQVHLMDSAGNVLASNDDSDNPNLGPYNSQIAGFVLPASGIYTIEATRFGQENGGTTGNYDLTIAFEDAAPQPAPTGSVISFGQTVSGEITSSATFQDWTFTGTAGEIVTITMAADGMASLDAFLQLLDSSGRELAVNDDANSDSLGVFDSQIQGYTLPGSGQYIIRAARIRGTGQYQLTLAAGAAAAANTISYGETVTGTVTEENYRNLWAFEGAQGEVVTITMIDASTNQALDSYLILIGPDNAVIAENDDAADTSIGAFNAQIANAPLPASGTYTIVATRFGEEYGNGTGTYELSLRQGK